MRIDLSKLGFGQSCKSCVSHLKLDTGTGRPLCEREVRQELAVREAGSVEPTWASSVSNLRDLSNKSLETASAKTTPEPASNNHYCTSP